MAKEKIFKPEDFDKDPVTNTVFPENVEAAVVSDSSTVEMEGV